MGTSKEDLATSTRRSRSPQRCSERKHHQVPTVLCLGISVLDYTVVLDAFPEPDSKRMANDQRLGGGGNAANTAVALARLGLHTMLVSKVGADSAGVMLREELEREGVCCDLFQRGSPGEKTVTCFLMVCGATRTIVSMPHAQRPVDIHASFADSLAFKDALRKSSLLHLDGRHPALAARAAECAREAGVPVLLEAERRQGVPTEDLEMLALALKCADFVVTSEDYPCWATGKATLEDGVRTLLRTSAPCAKWVVTTLGARGCIAVTRGEAGEFGELLTEAWEVEVVDTTGAGDAFIGGLAYSIVNKFPLERALATACWIGSHKCTAAGCRTALPTAMELASAENNDTRLRALCGT